MSIEVKVPMLPESVADATVAKWYKNPGDSVKRDENLVDLETDKVMLEVPAPEDGIIAKINKPVGSTVTADEILAVISANGSEAAQVEAKPEAKSEAKPSAPETTGIDLSPAVRRMVIAHELKTEE